jgi:hypothetical protein
MKHTPANDSYNSTVDLDQSAFKKLLSHLHATNRKFSNDRCGQNNSRSLLAKLLIENLLFIVARNSLLLNVIPALQKFSPFCLYRQFDQSVIVLTLTMAGAYLDDNKYR